jgi:hypothetical protein
MRLLFTATGLAWLFMLAVATSSASDVTYAPVEGCHASTTSGNSLFVSPKVEKAFSSEVWITANVLRKGRWLSFSNGGFSFSEHRYILTTAHTIEDEEGVLPDDVRIAVYLSDCSFQTARVVYVHQKDGLNVPDIMVLEIEHPPPPIPVSTLKLRGMRGQPVTLLDNRQLPNIWKRDGVVVSAMFFAEPLDGTENKKTRDAKVGNIKILGALPAILSKVEGRKGNSGDPLLDGQMHVLGVIMGVDDSGQHTVALPIALVMDYLKQHGVPLD